MSSPRKINQQAAIGSDLEAINTQGQQAIAKLENIRDVQVPRVRNTITTSGFMDATEKATAESELDAIAQLLIDRITDLYNSVTT